MVKSTSGTIGAVAAYFLAGSNSDRAENVEHSQPDCSLTQPYIAHSCKGTVYHYFSLDEFIAFILVLIHAVHIPSYCNTIISFLTLSLEVNLAPKCTETV